MLQVKILLLEPKTQRQIHIKSQIQKLLTFATHLNICAPTSFLVKVLEGLHNFGNISPQLFLQSKLLYFAGMAAILLFPFSSLISLSNMQILSLDPPEFRDEKIWKIFSAAKVRCQMCQHPVVLCICVFVFSFL